MLTYHEKYLLIAKTMGHTYYLVNIGDVLHYVIENNAKQIQDFEDYHKLNNEITNYRPRLNQTIPVYPEEQREPLIDFLLTLIPKEPCK